MLQVLVNGLIVGGIYALIAVGFNLIYSAVRFHHLAYAAVAVVGGYLSFFLQTSWGLNFFVGMVLSSVVTGFFGVLVWRFVYRPLRNRGASDVSMIVTAFGLLIVLQNLIALVMGTKAQSVSIVDEIRPGYEFFGLSVTFNQLMIFVVSLVVVVLFELVLNKTKIGMSIRAVGQNKKLAEVIGIPAEKVVNYTFFIATFLSVIGVTLVSLEISLRPSYALHLVLKVVVACIIGGMGSVRGALLGGLILGVAENLGIFVFGAEWQDVTAYLLLILFLLFLPQGLFAKKLRS